MAFGIARPHRSAADLRAYWLGCIILVLSIFVSLLLQGDAAALDSQSQTIMSVILIVLSVGLVAGAVRHACAAVLGAFRDTTAAEQPAAAAVAADDGALVDADAEAIEAPVVAAAVAADTETDGRRPSLHALLSTG
eukprot:5125-Heterococcus_DN1.PRE.1